jgi:hypothetical protein
MLDFAAEPNANFPTNIAVARSGVYDATMLRTTGGVSIEMCQPVLRLQGIFLEKTAVAPPFGGLPLKEEPAPKAEAQLGMLKGVPVAATTVPAAPPAKPGAPPIKPPVPPKK